jgi:hypothetical protein
VQVVAIGGRATLFFGAAFRGAAAFAPNLAILSTRRISNYFSTNILEKLEAPKNSRLQNHGKLHGASAPAVPRVRPIYINFDRKIVADSSSRQNRKSWGKNRGAAKS